MNAITPEFEAACQALIEKYFAAHPNAEMQRQAMRALRMLRSAEEPLDEDVQGWAAGIIYFVANDGRIPFGVPGMSNAEFEKFIGVKMSTAKFKAARVAELVIF